MRDVGHKHKYFINIITRKTLKAMKKFLISRTISNPWVLTDCE